MLRPITKKMTHEEEGGELRFTFYCDVCRRMLQIEPVQLTHSGLSPADEISWAAAFERANLEAMRYFNRCPLCKRWVCDECVTILPDRDICAQCAKATSKESGQTHPTSVSHHI